MDIQKEYDEIIGWANENGILLVKAELSNDTAPEITFNDDETDNANAFKEIVSKLEGKVIIYNSLLLTIEDYEVFLGRVKKQNNSDLFKKFITLEPYKNKILNYAFDFISNGAIYKLYNQVEELEIYEEILRTIYDNTNGYDNTNEYANKNSLPENEAKKLGRQLADNENYTKTKNRTQKEILAKKLFPELAKYGNAAYKSINVTAEEIYNLEIKPSQDKQLKDDIQKLKKEGKTKVNICSELNISLFIINKYY